METPVSAPTQQVSQHHQDEKGLSEHSSRGLFIRAICKDTTEAEKEVLSYHSFQGQTYSGGLVFCQRIYIKGFWKRWYK